MSTLSVDTIQGKTTAGTIAMPVGHVIQTITSETTTTITTTGTSFSASGHVVSITPKFSNSKIIVSLTGAYQTWGTQAPLSTVNMYRQLTGGSYTSVTRLQYLTMNSTYGLNHSSMYIDTSHNTTSAINYQPYIKVNQGQYWYNYDQSVFLTAMEIKQ